MKDGHCDDCNRSPFFLPGILQAVLSFSETVTEREVLRCLCPARLADSPASQLCSLSCCRPDHAVLAVAHRSHDEQPTPLVPDCCDLSRNCRGIMPGFPERCRGPDLSEVSPVRWHDDPFSRSSCRPRITGCINLHDLRLAVAVKAPKSRLRTGLIWPRASLHDMAMAPVCLFPGGSH